MGSQFELFDARLSDVRFLERRVELHFSYAHIHKTVGLPGRDTGKGWTQDTILTLEGAELEEPLPPLPNTIAEGYLEVYGERYELIPLPFLKEGPALLRLEFIDGNTVELRGMSPAIKLEGEKIFIEGYS